MQGAEGGLISFGIPIDTLCGLNLVSIMTSTYCPGIMQLFLYDGNDDEQR